jgi:transcriptional regulator with XRE-family HTH domain
MDDPRVGAAFRAVRLRRRWRQQDVSERARVSRALISLVERGHLDHISLASLRRVGAALDIRVDVLPRWRGGELDRLMSARHSWLHDSVAQALGTLPDWAFASEVSFSVYGERGVIDVLAYHAPTRSLLVIELKTAIIDINDILGGLDRKKRLAAKIAAQRGWDVATVSCWLIVDEGRTNRRRLHAHRHVIRHAFPDDGRRAFAWLRDPVGQLAAVSAWPNATQGHMPPASGQRVRRRNSLGSAARHGRGSRG